MGVKTVVAQFIPDKQSDGEATSQTNSHTYYIDPGIHFVFPYIPDGDDEVIFKHSVGL
jgi:hypothetical protein